MSQVEYCHLTVDTYLVQGEDRKMRGWRADGLVLRALKDTKQETTVHEIAAKEQQKTNESMEYWFLFDDAIRRALLELLDDLASEGWRVISYTPLGYLAVHGSSKIQRWPFGEFLLVRESTTLP